MFNRRWWDNVTVRVVGFCVAISMSNIHSVSAQTNSQRDAVIGGVAGAILGGIAGKQNDETPEGIAIGGVAGAIAGHVIGKAKDRTIQDQYYYQQQSIQAARQRQQHHAVQLQKAISIQDAISLSNSGVSPQLIINQIHANGVQQEIGVSEIITLHQNGVSELVINEMQRSALGGIANNASVNPTQNHSTILTRQQPVVVQSAPVIVSRPRPTIVIEHGRPYDVYRSHRGYHPHQGQYRSARGHDIYYRR